jgi:hypothetical protein
MEAIRLIVLGEDELQTSLLSTTDANRFAEAVAAIASDHGLPLRPEDVREALAAERRRVLERWV